MKAEEKAREILDKDEQWKYFNLLEDITAEFLKYELRIEKLRAALEFYVSLEGWVFDIGEHAATALREDG